MLITVLEKFSIVVSPAILAMERPRPMVEYAKDITVATKESPESSLKLGIWLNMISMMPKMIINMLFLT